MAVLAEEGAPVTAPTSSLKRKPRARKPPKVVVADPDVRQAVEGYRRERAEQTAMTQMNVRIPRALKRRGDEALAAMGVSPSFAVRRIYELAVEHEREPEEFYELLGIEAARQQDEFRRRLRAVSEGPLLYERARRELGLADEPSPEMLRILRLPWKEMREALYELDAKHESADEEEPR